MGEQRPWPPRFSWLVRVAFPVNSWEENFKQGAYLYDVYRNWSICINLVLFIILFEYFHQIRKLSGFTFSLFPGEEPTV